MEPNQTPLLESAIQSGMPRLLFAGSALVAALFFVAVAESVPTFAPRTNPAPQTASVDVSDPIPKISQLALQAKSAYVVDLSTGEVLYSQHANVQLPLASITKIALVLAVSEVLDPNDSVRISRDAITRGEGGGLGTGDLWRVQTLIDFTLVASSNAGAEALAEAADAKLHEKYSDSPSEHATIWRMNQLAKELGLNATYFLNPSGLDASVTQPGSMSSAHDVAALLERAAKSPHLFTATKEKGLALGPKNGVPKPVANTNEALPDIPDLVLGKTGYTDLAGGNLGIIFKARTGHAIVAVVLGSTEEGRFSDMKKLVDSVGKSFLGG